MGFTMFACCLLDIMYLVLLLFNDTLLILSHSLILDTSLLMSVVMFLFVSSLNESIVLESVVSSAYIMKWKRSLDSGKSFIYIRKRSAPKMDPWGTPVTIDRDSDIVSFSSTNCCLFDK